MALAKVLSSTLLGVDAHRVEVGVDLANCGFPFPLRRITVNLAPAHLRKAGTAFDLPIALGVLQAAGYIQSQMLSRYQVVGELSLDGRVKAVAGALPMAVGALEAGVDGMVVPLENAAEAAVVEGVPVFGVETLAQAIGFFNGTEDLPPITAHQTCEKAHGCLETRRVMATEQIAWLHDSHGWPGLCSIAKVESRCELLAEGKAVRTYRGVENGLHWVMDMVFRDDECRCAHSERARHLRHDQAPGRDALRRGQGKHSMRASRHITAWNEDFLYSLLTQ